MNTTTITNATNGMIVRVTQFHAAGRNNRLLIMLGVLAVGMIGLGVYLLLRKEKGAKT